MAYAQCGGWLNEFISHMNMHNVVQAVTFSHKVWHAPLPRRSNAKQYAHVGKLCIPWQTSCGLLSVYEFGFCCQLYSMVGTDRKSALNGGMGGVETARVADSPALPDL